MMNEHSPARLCRAVFYVSVFARLLSETFTPGRMNVAASKAAFEELQRQKYIRYEDLPLETSDGRRLDLEFVSNVYEVNVTIGDCAMKKTLKWFGISLGVLLVIVLGAFYFKGNGMLNRTYTIASENTTIPTDAASIARGKHFVQAICTDCHQPDLSGKNMIAAPFARIDSANLTPSPSGAGSKFKDADWVRALRHGVDDQGRALVVMPAQEFWNFSDQDLGDIVAYLKTLPPVDKQHKDPQSNILGKIMIGAGLFGKDIVPANVIAHTQRPSVVPVGVTAQYGEYLVNVSGRHDCHGAQLAGGKNAKPGALDAPNLTPGGDLKTWSEAGFINTVRTGMAPNGHKLKPDEMPWKFFGTYSDDELTAIFLYLQSLQPLQTIKP